MSSDLAGLQSLERLVASTDEPVSSALGRALAQLDAELHGLLERQRRLEHTFTVLREIFEAISPARDDQNDNVFRALARGLAGAVGATHAGIGAVASLAADRIRTLGLWSGGSFAPDVEYDLEGSPCAVVLERGSAYWSESVQSAFPDFAVLRELGANSYMGAALLDDAGGPLGIVFALHDRPLEDPRAAEGVMAVVGERARLELVRRSLEVDLIEARRVAESASTVRREFIRNISHEIRTPMNGLFGMMSLLLETGLSGEQQDYVNAAYHACEELMQLIGAMLDYSKLESGQLELHSVDLDPRKIIQEVTERYRAQARRKGLSLRCRFSDDFPPALKGDPARLRQILKCLVSNAVKFTHFGGVLISSEACERSDGKVLVRVRVADTGIGIAPEHRGKLFQPFRQVDGSYTRRYAGSGLGLATARQLAELMGGEVGVESEPKKGSTFWFTALFEPVRETGESRRQRGAEQPGSPVVASGPSEGGGAPGPKRKPSR